MASSTPFSDDFMTLARSLSTADNFAVSVTLPDYGDPCIGYPQSLASSASLAVYKHRIFMNRKASLRFHSPPRRCLVCFSVLSNLFISFLSLHFLPSLPSIMFLKSLRSFVLLTGLCVPRKSPLTICFRNSLTGRQMFPRPLCPFTCRQISLATSPILQTLSASTIVATRPGVTASVQPAGRSPQHPQACLRPQVLAFSSNSFKFSSREIVPLIQVLFVAFHGSHTDRRRDGFPSHRRKRPD